jgi:dTDP-glucose pyrophosphorylase
MPTSLLILAAGLGSRYGALKQMDRFGPEGQTLMDYSVEDALAAGIQRVVFVIRRDFEEAFEEAVLRRVRGRAEIVTVFQEMDRLPGSFKPPLGRLKPWGTAHAVLAAKDALDGPFVMVNADDYYGPEAFRSLAAFLHGHQASGHSAMAAYALAETLSEHGGVTRAICGVDGGGFLTDMVEWKGIQRKGPHEIAGDRGMLTGNECVSMNCFAFQGDFMASLEAQFQDFLAAHASSLTDECLIPDVVGALVRQGTMHVKVLGGHANWFGVTYPQDKTAVASRLAALRGGRALQAP